VSWRTWRRVCLRLRLMLDFEIGSSSPVMDGGEWSVTTEYLEGGY
jgi:hypothetical protein